jgi:hypothetical protein
VKRILRYKLFFQAAAVGIVVLLLMLAAAHFKLNVITINTLTGTFFGGVFFTISIVFTGAMADFKEAEKITGEIAVLLKAMPLSGIGAHHLRFCQKWLGVWRPAAFCLNYICIDRDSTAYSRHRQSV